MTDTFKIDEVALWYSPNYPEYHGMEVTVMENLQSRLVEGEMIEAYKIDPGFPHPPGYTGWSSKPKHLKKLPPQNDLTSWEEMSDIFKPKVLETV